MDILEPIAIARINEPRQASVTRDLSEEWIPIADGVASFSAGVGWINHGTRIGFDADVPDAELDRMEAFYRDRGQTPKIELTTFATEAFLAQLGARGFVTEHYENVLARPLTPGENPFDAMTHPVAEGLEIQPVDVTDDDACREYGRTVCRGFMPDPIPEEQIEMTVRAIRHERSAAFRATVDGHLAGVAGMETYEHEGQRVCALWGAVVEPRFRRRGVQQAFIARRLAHGLGLGCVAALIESKPGIATERNAARLGFHLAYVRTCMVKLHEKRPASPQ